MYFAHHVAFDSPFEASSYVLEWRLVDRNILWESVSRIRTVSVAVGWGQEAGYEVDFLPVFVPWCPYGFVP